MTRLETTLCLMCQLSPRDLVSIPDNMDETVLHTGGSLSCKISNLKCDIVNACAYVMHMR